MENKIIGFIGIEIFDVLVYLSRILTKLDKKVLIVDHTNSLTLDSIPKPQGLDFVNHIITYKKIDFTATKIIWPDLLKHYDNVFISYGLEKINEENIKLCNKIVFVTNMFNMVHHRLHDINSKLNLSTKKEVIIKDAIDLRMDFEHIAEVIVPGIKEEDINIIYRDDKDFENSINTFNNLTFQINVSNNLKKYLISKISSLYPDIDLKLIKSAFKIAKKGD